MMAVANSLQINAREFMENTMMLESRVTSWEKVCVVTFSVQMGATTAMCTLEGPDFDGTHPIRN